MLLVQEEAMVESDLLPLKHKSGPIIQNLMTKTKIFDRISNFETDYIVQIKNNDRSIVD